MSPSSGSGILEAGVGVDSFDFVPRGGSGEEWSGSSKVFVGEAKMR